MDHLELARENPVECADQVEERTGPAGADVRHAEAAPVELNGIGHPPCDILHEHEVACLPAVTENGQRPPGGEPVGEDRDDPRIGRRWILPRPVDVEEPQRRRGHAEAMRVPAKELLEGELGGPVGAERAGRCILVHRQGLGLPVDRRGGGENETPDACTPCGLEHDVAAREVEPKIQIWVLNASRDTHQRGQVNDPLGPNLLEEPADSLLLTDIALDELEQRLTFK